jgi:hypothetical protein
MIRSIVVQREGELPRQADQRWEVKGRPVIA